MFSQISSGTCESNGAFLIGDPDTCKAAWQDLVSNSTHAVETEVAKNAPPGCYYSTDWLGDKKLVLNLDVNNQNCSKASLCLCAPLRKPRRSEDGAGCL